MLGRLKSNYILTGDIGGRLIKENENKVSPLSLTGETNLDFKVNLQSMEEEVNRVLEAYLEACRLNGETITTFGDGFEEIDSQYAGE